MGDDLEELKLQVELAKVKYGFRQVLVVSVIGPILLGLIQLGIAYYQRTETKAAAEDVKAAAITQAAVVKEEVVAAKAETDRVLSDIGTKVDATVIAADASVKSWKAYNTKMPDDENVAAQAVTKAEQVNAAVMP